MSEQEIGNEVIVLDTVGSTNKEAADRLALSQLAHGTVILAHEQTEDGGSAGATGSIAPTRTSLSVWRCFPST